MPLRDHFHSPLSTRRHWQGFHAAWPTAIINNIFPDLPDGYIAEPRVNVGPIFEVDVATFEEDEIAGPIARLGADYGAAVLTWTPPEPTLALMVDRPDQAQYEVRIYNTGEGLRLVAAIEIVSPANKDRPEHRRAFVAKCAALMRNQVCVTMIDFVTERTANLYGELLHWIGLDEVDATVKDSSLYAVTCRWTKGEMGGFLESWNNPLEIGLPLPTLPLWLDQDVAIALDLEASYEETRRVLRIP